MVQAIIKIPIHDIEIRIVDNVGEITSNLHRKEQRGDGEAENCYEAAVDALESLILACACEGIAVTSEAFVRAIQTSVDAISNQF